MGIKLVPDEELVAFLKSRVKFFEEVENSKMINIWSVGFVDCNNQKSQEKRGLSQTFVSTSEVKCYICGLSHKIYMYLWLNILFT